MNRIFERHRLLHILALGLLVLPAIALTACTQGSGGEPRHFYGSGGSDGNDKSSGGEQN